MCFCVCLEFNYSSCVLTCAHVRIAHTRVHVYARTYTHSNTRVRLHAYIHTGLGVVRGFAGGTAPLYGALPACGRAEHSHASNVHRHTAIAAGTCVYVCMCVFCM
jgi:hypothetical protein